MFQQCSAEYTVLRFVIFLILNTVYSPRCTVETLDNSFATSNSKLYTPS